MKIWWLDRICCGEALKKADATGYAAIELSLVRTQLIYAVLISMDTLADPFEGVLNYGNIYSVVLDGAMTPLNEHIPAQPGFQYMIIRFLMIEVLKLQ